jgi:hypothetical protein
VNPTTRRLLLVFALIVLFAIAAVVPIEQKVSGPCRLESAATWYLARNGAGQITTGWERNLLHSSGGGSLMLQFERPDFVEIKLSPGLRQGQSVSAGDTVAWVESHEGSGRLRVLEAELERARSLLDGLNAGARPADVQVAEHDYSRSTAALDVSQLEFLRAKSLYDSGYGNLAEVQITEGILEERQAESDLAYANIIALKEGARQPDIRAGEAEVLTLVRSVETAQNLLGGREPIVTPISGIVDFSGGMVDILIRIERSDTLAVITRVPEAALPLIAFDHPMNVTLDADPQGTRPVTIVDFSFSATEIPAAFAVGLVRNDQGILRSGMTGQARCSIGSRTLLEGVRARVGALGF